MQEKEGEKQAADQRKHAEFDASKAKRLLNAARKRTEDLKSKVSQAETRILEKDEEIQTLEAKNEKLLELAQSQQQRIQDLEDKLSELESSGQKINVQYGFIDSDDDLNENGEAENAGQSNSQNLIDKVIFRTKYNNDMFCLCEYDNGSLRWLSEIEILSEDLPDITLPSILDLSKLEQTVLFGTNSTNPDSLDLQQQLGQIKIEFEVERRRKDEEISTLVDQKARLQQLFQNRKEIFEEHDNYKHKLSELNLQDTKQRKQIEILTKKVLSLEDHILEMKEQNDQSIKSKSKCAGNTEELERLKHNLNSLLSEKNDTEVALEKLKMDFYSCLQFLSDYLAEDDGMHNPESNNLRKAASSLSSEEIEVARDKVISLLMRKVRHKKSSFFS